MNKTCTKCGIEQDTKNFSKCITGKFGVRGDCKMCRKRYYHLTENKRQLRVKKYREINKVKQREFYLRHREHIREKQKEYHKHNFLQIRNQMLKLTYGITQADYDILFRQQNEVCAICYKSVKGYLSIDHDHKTGKIRGLLCKQCNHGLGMFKDDKLILINAANYSKKYEN